MLTLSSRTRSTALTLMISHSTTAEARIPRSYYFPRCLINETRLQFIAIVTIVNFHYFDNTDAYHVFMYKILHSFEYKWFSSRDDK